jgi:sugar phosphate isomerase/epimerase
MQIGVLTRTFVRPTIEACFDAIAAHGMTCVQLGLVSAGLPPMPYELDPAVCDRIREAASTHDIAMPAVTGTFNMIHPDPRERDLGLRRLRVLARSCARLGIPLVTLCTGSRDPDNMWRRHPANDAPDAWTDLLDTMERALAVADEAGVTLGVEPEVSNVVDCAAKARRLLDTMRSARLKIVMDGANIFHAGELPRMHELLGEAFDLLGADITLAHAKDLCRDGEAGQQAAGTGLLDYDRYLALLRAAGYDGPMLLHSLEESQVAGSVAFLRAKLAGPA